MKATPEELTEMTGVEREWLSTHFIGDRVKNNEQGMVATIALMQTACALICAAAPLEMLIASEVENDFTNQFREFFKMTAKGAIAVKAASEFSQHMKEKYGDSPNSAEQA